ncbi:Fc.00g008300.m01.CDS01 [Cosmosporella sp. VM-42]
MPNPIRNQTSNPPVNTGIIEGENPIITTNIPEDLKFTMRQFTDEPGHRHHRAPPGFQTPRSVADSKKRMEEMVQGGQQA